MQIEPYAAEQLEAIVRLSLRAWEPVFISIEKSMQPEVYQVFYPHGWEVSQQKAVEEICAAKDTHVWVAIVNDVTVGFIAVNLHTDDSMGEIYMIAVDPDYQDQGIGSELTDFALDWIKNAGMSVAMVETGADYGHTSARRTYEKAGFKLWPVARYFKKL